MPIVRRLAQMIQEHDEVEEIPLPAWGPSFLSSVVSREDNRIDPHRGDDEFIHVSSLVKDWCPRKYSLMKRLDVAGHGKQVTGGHRVMWAVGRAVEKHVRDQFIRGVNYHGVWGVWKCKCEKTESTGFVDRVKKCSLCHTHLLGYNEFTLKDTTDRVAGNPDLIYVRKNTIYAVEIKSVTDSESANKSGIGYTSLTQPYADHLFQVFAYHLKLERILAPRIDARMGKFAIVLYTTKDFKYGSPYKEYHVSADKTKWLIDDTIKPRLRGAKAAWDAANDTKKPLPRKICPTMNCPMAKGCPVAIECFAM